MPFFKEHLQWRVIDKASQAIDDDQQLRDTGLKIKVVRRKFDVPTDDNKLGVYSDPAVYQRITEGKLGGYGWVSGIKLGSSRRFRHRKTPDP